MACRNINSTTGVKRLRNRLMSATQEFVIGDLKEVRTPGLYQIGIIEGSTGLPTTGQWGYSLLEVFQRGSMHRLQRLTALQQNIMAIRVSWDKGENWTNWLVIPAPAQSSAE